MAGPPASVRFGMTGDATLATVPMGDDHAAPQPTYTVPATAIFHKDSGPAVWVIEGGGSTLQLRPVKVSTYTDHATVVTAGLNDGDVVVLAGVHTVYAGQHVRPVRPLFDGEGDVEGPASAGTQGPVTAGTQGTATAGAR
jgi:hypothetical protein